MSKYKSFSDHFGDGEFHPDLPRIGFKDLLDKEVIVYELKVLKDFNSKFGKHDCALFLMAPPDAEKDKFTTICSGVVVLNRVKDVLASEKPLLPMSATPVEVETDDGTKYYNLL